MAKRIVEIDYCNECPFYSKRVGLCFKLPPFHRTIKIDEYGKFPIPNDCPLPKHDEFKYHELLKETLKLSNDDISRLPDIFTK